MPTHADTAAADIAVVESFFEALRTQDLERAFALLSDDIVYQNVPFPADHGKPAVMRTLKAFGIFVSGFDVQMRNIAARDGVVLTERLDILSGRLVYLDLPVCGTLEVRDGKITLWRDYFDLASAAGKLMVSPLRSLFPFLR
ncbi:MAG: Limonene-1,2-epoxide hydrolase [bacterium]|nr:Limonene-1,2-epoxide hydrolase [bacterium]